MRTHYLFHILIWMVPCLAIQWLIGPRILWNNRLAIFATSLLTAGYLTFADSFAIASGVWFFDPTQTLGLKVGPHVPVEEALFFLFTSLLVTQSFVLFLPPSLRHPSSSHPPRRDGLPP